MKTYDLEVTKALSTTIRVTVPDDFDEGKLRHSVYGRLLRRVADGQVYDGDWDDDSGEVEVEAVLPVEDDGEYEVADITAPVAARDAELKRLYDEHLAKGTKESAP